MLPMPSAVWILVIPDPITATVYRPTLRDNLVLNHAKVPAKTQTPRFLEYKTQKAKLTDQNQEPRYKAHSSGTEDQGPKLKDLILRTTARGIKLRDAGSEATAQGRKSRIKDWGPKPQDQASGTNA